MVGRIWAGGEREEPGLGRWWDRRRLCLLGTAVVGKAVDREVGRRSVGDGEGIVAVGIESGTGVEWNGLAFGCV